MKPLPNQDLPEEDIEQQARSALYKGAQGLQFESALEQRFQKVYVSRYLAMNRKYILVAALILFLLGFADQFLSLELTKTLLEIRVIAALLLLSLAVLSLIKFFARHFQILLCFGAYAMHISVIMITAHASLAGEYYYQSGSLLSIMFICTVLRLQFHYILPLAIVIWFSQVLAMHFAMAISVSKFVELMFVHTFITTLSVMACFRLEHEIRLNFLRQLLSRADRQKLEEADQALYLAKQKGNNQAASFADVNDQIQTASEPKPDH